MLTDAAGWRELLERWNADLFATPEIADGLPEEVKRSGWLGAPPATPEQIRNAETRLGAAPPLSYRPFLAVTNGWRCTGFGASPGPIWPIQHVDSYRARHQDLIDAGRLGERSQGPPEALPHDAYLVYGENQDSTSLRSEYLETALQISEHERAGTAVYFLNPVVVTSEGEWEAWMFAHWLPGARRYRSFWELMGAEYRMFLRVRRVMPPRAV